jgi:hypothetical protein
MGGGTRVRRSGVVFWVGFMLALSVSMIWGSQRYMAGELLKPAAAEAESGASAFVLEPLGYYMIVLENPDHEDAFELGKKLAAGGFAVVAAGEPSNRVAAGVAKKAENLAGLQEALRSGGWQSRVEEQGIPRTELAYSPAFLRNFGPFLIQTHRWAGRLVDFLDDPWDRIRSAPEAKERLAILAEELALCVGKANRELETALPEERAAVRGVLDCMERVGQGITALEEEGRHDYLTQQAAAFLCQWKDMICRNLS